MLTIIVVFLILLLLSGFFSSAEIAMMSLTQLQVGRLVKKKRRNAKRLAMLKENPHKLLETILIGNNLVNIAAAAIATALSIQLFGDAGIGIATGITTFMVLLFGEIIPKSLAVNHRKAIALAITPILYGLQWLLTPIIFFIDAIASFFTKLFGEPEQERITEEEVIDIVQASEQDGSLKKREREMIQSVLELDDTCVGEIMTPRLDVFCLEMHQRIVEVVDGVLESGYSRIPVYDRLKDRLKGVVLVKDLLRALKEGREQEILKGVMQHVLFVPESKKLDSVLREFQRKKSPFAIVVDEHGLFIGIVTIEDVLEELVGEIYDENDTVNDTVVQKLDATTFSIPGKMPIADLNDKHAFKLPVSDEYDTLGGFLMNRLGRIPLVGDQVEYDHWLFTIDRLSQHRIITVKAVKH